MSESKALANSTTCEIRSFLYLDEEGQAGAAPSGGELELLLAGREHHLGQDVGEPGGRQHLQGLHGAPPQRQA